MTSKLNLSQIPMYKKSDISFKGAHKDQNVELSNIKFENL